MNFAGLTSSNRVAISYNLTRINRSPIFPLGRGLCERPERQPLQAIRLCTKMDVSIATYNRAGTLQAALEGVAGPGETILYSPDAIVYRPVDPKRTTRAQFRSWYYYNGRSVTRLTGLEDGGRKYFGVLRWFARDWATRLVKWRFCVDRARRFHNQLKAYRSAGVMAGAYRLSRRKRAMPWQPVLERIHGD